VSEDNNIDQPDEGPEVEGHKYPSGRPGSAAERAAGGLTEEAEGAGPEVEGHLWPRGRATGGDEIERPG
jgi:hypothetical protein